MPTAVGLILLEIVKIMVWVACVKWTVDVCKTGRLFPNELMPTCLTPHIHVLACEQALRGERKMGKENGKKSSLYPFLPCEEPALRLPQQASAFMVKNTKNEILLKTAILFLSQQDLVTGPDYTRKENYNSRTAVANTLNRKPKYQCPLPDCIYKTEDVRGEMRTDGI